MRGGALAPVAGKAHLSITAATAHAACTTAMDIGADAILTVSQAGITAQMVSRFRPDTLIVALLLDEQVQRQMALYWGVEPITMPRASSSDELVDLAVRSAEQAGLVRRGDLVVVTAGVPVGISGTTNMIRVQQVGGSLVNAVGIGHAADLRPAVRVPHDGRGTAEVPQRRRARRAVHDERHAAVSARGGGDHQRGGQPRLPHGDGGASARKSPSCIDATDATRRLKDGVMVSVDCARGVVQTLPQ